MSFSSVAVNHGNPAMPEWNEYLARTTRNLLSQALTHKILIERICDVTPPGGKILEAGCGMAYLSALLADMGFAATAGDLDEKVLEAAQARIQIPHQTVAFCRLDLMKLTSQFRAKEFDTICHSGVMEHFDDEAIVHSLCEQRAISKAVVFKIPNGRTKMLPEHFGNERFMSNAKWRRLIARAGFRDIEIHGGESLPKIFQLLPALLHAYPKCQQRGAKRKISELLAAWRKYVSYHSIFVCR